MNQASKAIEEMSVNLVSMDVTGKNLLLDLDSFIFLVCVQL